MVGGESEGPGRRPRAHDAGVEGLRHRLGGGSGERKEGGEGARRGEE